MRKLMTAIVVVPLTIIFVIFSVVNRQIVTVSFDPFDGAHPAFELKLPLFLLIFTLLGLGVLIGGIASWFNQHKWRARARSAEAEARQLRAKLTESGVHDDPPPRQTAPPAIAPPVA